LGAPCRVPDHARGDEGDRGERGGRGAGRSPTTSAASGAPTPRNDRTGQQVSDLSFLAMEVPRAGAGAGPETRGLAKQAPEVEVAARVGAAVLATGAKAGAIDAERLM